MTKFGYTVFELRRLIRVRKIWLILIVLFAPVLSQIAGIEILFGGTFFVALLIPVAVAWSWGRDLQQGSLTPLALAARRPMELFAVRFAALSMMLTPWLLAAALSSPREIILLVSFSVQMLALGFLLATLYRTPEVGWIPIVFQFVAVWFPLMRQVRASGSEENLSLWVRGGLALLVPTAASRLGAASDGALIIISITAALVWVTFTILLLQRPGVFEGKDD